MSSDPDPSRRQYGLLVMRSCVPVLTLESMEPVDFWAIASEHCTTSELDVLRIRARGITNREGAELLGISKKAYERRLRRATDRMQNRRFPRSGRQMPKVETSDE